MAASTSERRKVVEGIFAISKPQWTSSAGVLRDLQDHFADSALFAPWLTHTRRNMIMSHAKPRLINNLKLKMGHGGTLDPLATGVMVVGVGRGTKCLQRFLECTKTYECTVLFGAATDSYDAVGKVVSRAPYDHITKELVESKLEGFRGKIMQKPSVFSALKVDGKKMYEYAREGGDIPEVAARPVEVRELEMLEWLEPGTHDFAWPKEEVDGSQMEGAEKLLGIRKKDADVTARRNKSKKRSPSRSPERSTETKKSKTDNAPSTEAPANPTIDPDDHVSDSASHPREPATADEPAMSGALPAEDIPETTTAQPETSLENDSESKPQPPAARIRMTVTSGFYVRSFCHDLGLACDSLGLMSTLIRSRQGDYELGKNVLEWSEVEAGPEAWEPKLRKELEGFMEKEGWVADMVEDDEAWDAREKEVKQERREGDRDRSFRGGRKGGGRGRGGKGWQKRD